MPHVKELYQLSKELDLLYVEDDEQLRIQMGEMFSELFRSTHLAENGQIGLEMYEKKLAKEGKAYDLVITDVNMPVLNGIDMIKAIYKLAPMQPVIVMSAHNESHYLLDLLHIGVNSFLMKPTQHSILVNTLFHNVQAIVNERLVKSHYAHIEQLNAQLAEQSEALQKSYDELRQKNIALEKSLRIIEGIHHKQQLQHSMPFPARSAAVSDDDANDPGDEHSLSQNCLETIGDLVDRIARSMHYKAIGEETLAELSESMRSYCEILGTSPRYTTLHQAIAKLAETVSRPPKRTDLAHYEKIITMLESFFFIYGKWQKEWPHSEDAIFEKFSQSIADEVQLIIDLWEGRL